MLTTFENADVVAGRIYTVKDIFEDEHYRARHDIVEVPDPDFGAVKMPGVFPKFSRAEYGVRWTGGRLGQHNVEIFNHLLGLADEELAAAEAEGVIWTGAPFVTAYGSSPYEKGDGHELLWHLAEATCACLEQAGLTKDEIDGLALASFSYPPGSVVTLAEHFGMRLRWAEQGAFGGRQA